MTTTSSARKPARSRGTQAASAPSRTSPNPPARNAPAQGISARPQAAPLRPAPDPDASFAELGVPAPLIASLASGGITTPFPIQTATLGDSLAGRDILGRGRTGSGKTVAFALPLIAALASSSNSTRPGYPRGMILVPTRELAAQVDATVAPLAKSMGMRTRVIFGGVGQGPQVAALKAGVDVIIATPGRLEDLIQQGHVRLSAVEVTVIDEADHMADLGFLPPVKRLLDLTAQGGQRMLFSATLDSGVDVLAKRYLSNPVTHSIDSAQSHVPAMTHHVFAVSAADRAAVVHELVGGQGRTLAFTRTKHQARKWAKQLTTAGIPAVDLHGNLSQGARQRNLSAFSTGEVRVLVATDIAARGIHVDDINLVVHVDPPAEHKAYLHRSGRTARAGADGVVVTIGTPDQRSDIQALMRQASIVPTTQAVRPGDPAITAIAGPAAPPTFTAPAVQVQSAGSAAGGGGRSRSAGRSGPSGRPGASGRTGSSGRAAPSGRGTPAQSRTATAPPRTTVARPAAPERIAGSLPSGRPARGSRRATR